MSNECRHVDESRRAVVALALQRRHCPLGHFPSIFYQPKRRLQLQPQLTPLPLIYQAVRPCRLHQKGILGTLIN